MDVDRPAVGEELNDGPPTEPRRAATVILLGGGDAPLEVLLVRRNPAARFMPGAWVFPGGAVDASEGEGEAALRAAAVREAREEAGIELPDPDALIRFSRWITPRRLRIRYDTHFFLAPMPAGAVPRVDGGEVVDARWYSPAAALEAFRAGEIELVFPTLKHLERLAQFSSSAALLEWARDRTVEPVEPRVVVEGEVARVVLPGEPGYAE